MTPLLFRPDIIALLDAAIARAGCVNSLAALAGVRPAHIEKVRAGKHDPCPALLRALSLRAVASWAPLDGAAQTPPAPGTREALAADLAGIEAASAGAAAACRRAGRAIAAGERLLERRARSAAAEPPA
jgi:hypothetical protein